jgi:non-specific serine/threonine protein kinase/NIMA (never in mitosis gene a)-related kinase
MDREQHLNIVMIHCEGGDIYQKIRLKKPFSENQILDWFSQMSLAMFYLHE